VVYRNVIALLAAGAGVLGSPELRAEPLDY
jgi:hypothetical protein